jgi:hypothetical protein
MKAKSVLPSAHVATSASTLTAQFCAHYFGPAGRNDAEQAGRLIRAHIKIKSEDIIVTLQVSSPFPYSLHQPILKTISQTLNLIKY